MGRVPALDGLRAVAIAMVVAYHVDKGLVPAGHWGVHLFFVLSGFVITSSICAEIDRSGGLKLASFYRKRLLRLVPPVVAVCVALLAVGAEWSKVMPTLGFYANYARIENIDLGRLAHTWFIAVILQFYVLWPLVMGRLPARLRTPVIGGLAVAAIVWRLVAIEVMSPGWVYNSSDTNAAGLLIGAFLAVAPVRTPRIAALATPGLMVLMFFGIFGDTIDGVLWGAFLALVLSALAVQHATTGPAWLEHRVLLRVAEVSFGIYLWHYVFVRSDIPLWTAAVWTAAATIVSWYCVEQPILRWDATRRDRRAASEPSIVSDRRS